MSMATIGRNLLIYKHQEWKALSGSDRSRLIQAWILLPMLAIALPLWGLHRIQALLAQDSAQHATQCSSGTSTASVPPIDWSIHPTIHPTIHQTVRLVNIANRYSIWKANCLRRSLVLWYLLRQQGIVSNLRIGVCREEGTFKAHAWVEYQGIVLNDSPTVHEQFAPFEQAIEG